MMVTLRDIGGVSVSTPGYRGQYPWVQGQYPGTGDSMRTTATDAGGNVQVTESDVGHMQVTGADAGSGM